MAAQPRGQINPDDPLALFWNNAEIHQHLSEAVQLAAETTRQSRPFDRTGYPPQGMYFMVNAMLADALRKFRFFPEYHSSQHSIVNLSDYDCPVRVVTFKGERVIRRLYQRSGFRTAEHGVVVKQQALQNRHHFGKQPRLNGLSPLVTPKRELTIFVPTLVTRDVIDCWLALGVELESGGCFLVCDDQRHLSNIPISTVEDIQQRPPKLYALPSDDATSPYDFPPIDYIGDESNTDSEEDESNTGA